MRSIKILTIILLGIIIGDLSAAARPQEEPRVTKKVQPSYPTILKAAGIEGTVLVKVFIDEKGRVEKAELAQASNKDFVPSVMEAVKQWEFEPATRDGKPIRTEATIPFRFKLGEGSYAAKDEDLLGLEKLVENFLRGGPVDSIKASIGTEAYAVIGKKFEPLLSMVRDPDRLKLLVEGKDSQTEYTRTVTDDSDDSAFLVMKTHPAKGKPGRFHTIVFMRSSRGPWRIQAWQTSS